MATRGNSIPDDETGFLDDPWCREFALGQIKGNADPTWNPADAEPAIRAASLLNRTTSNCRMPSLPDRAPPPWIGQRLLS
jgi:hypothetical protein